MNRSLMLILFALTACGSSSVEYRQSVSELQTVVVAHQNESATASDCALEHRRYDDSARPLLRQMTMMSSGSMHSMCGSMRSELDRHATAACTGDAVTNQAEAMHHCQLMQDWLGRQQRCNGSMMCSP